MVMHCAIKELPLLRNPCGCAGAAAGAVRPRGGDLDLAPLAPRAEPAQLHPAASRPRGAQRSHRAFGSSRSAAGHSQKTQNGEAQEDYGELVLALWDPTPLAFFLALEESYVDN